MPELPEVETVIRYLRTVCLNKTITKVDIRLIKLLHEIEPDTFQKKLVNRAFSNIIRRGKYLLFILDNGNVMVSHLRMEGKYIYEEELNLGKHDHIVFHFKDSTVLKYNDTRQFGTFHFFESLEAAYEHKILHKLGVEPFSDDMNIDVIYPLMKQSKKAIKIFLLDQSKITGIGNIYANEILFAVGLNPESITCKITKHKAQEIIDATKDILTDSIKHNGTTIHTFKFNKWSTGDYQQYLKVHQQKICPKCNGPLDFYFVGQRGTYSCKKCQRGKK